MCSAVRAARCNGPAAFVSTSKPNGTRHALEVMCGGISLRVGKKSVRELPQQKQNYYVAQQRVCVCVWHSAQDRCDSVFSVAMGDNTA